jgi:hypothetical protein
MWRLLNWDAIEVPHAFSACAPFEKVEMLFKLGYRVSGHRGENFTREDLDALKMRFENVIAQFRQEAADAVSLQDAFDVNRDFERFTEIFDQIADEDCQRPPPLQFIQGLQPIDVERIFDTADDARKQMMVRFGLMSEMFLEGEPVVVDRETAPTLFQALRAQPFNDDFLVTTTNMISQRTGVRRLERPISESEFTEWLLDAVSRHDEPQSYSSDDSSDESDFYQDGGE